MSEDSYWPSHSGLIHGDLHPPHIIINDQSEVTGLLDWTEAEVSDPAKDFVIYLAIFGEQGLADLIQRYEQAGGRVWPRMHEHIAERLAAYPALIGKFALITDKEEHMAMARNALGLAESE
ncbi:Phosphotransferase enzyme family protein [compost metagenome]